jgi:hypothetical protein
MIYFLDTNVLIRSKNDEFSFDETPDFWALILNLGQQKIVRIAKEVYDEIEKGNDELARWLKKHKKDLVHESSTDVYTSLKNEVLPAYLDGTGTAEETFLETAGADPWVIAHAHSSDGVVISFEKENPPGQTQPKPSHRKVPSICRQLNVKRMSLAKFLWKHRKIV